MQKEDRLLLSFAIGSFHTVILTLVLLIPIYLGGNLANTISDLSTGGGLLVFVVLWSTTVLSTHYALRDSQLDLTQPPDVSKVLRAGRVWGSRNGAFFLWGMPVAGTVAGLFIFATEGSSTVLLVAVAGAGLVVLGTFFAGIVGYAIGILVAVLDLALLSIARSLAR